MHTCFHRRAFTLIELLTVIAIMSILASMIMPSLSRAREMGRRTSCTSNMRQLGLGFRQYVDDYDGRFPGAGQYQKWGDGGHWVVGTDNAPVAKLTFAEKYVRTGSVNVEGGALYPYVKSTQIYVCPSSSDGREKGLDYSMNCALAGQPEFGIQNQTDVVLLVDEDKPSDGFFWASTDSLSSDHLTSIHNGGGNLLFCDSHTKFYPFAVFPIGDNTQVTGAGEAKTRTTGQPRFFDSSAGGTSSAFGSCNVTATPTPSPTP